MANREKISQYVKSSLINGLNIDCSSVQIFDEYIFIELWDKNDHQRKFRINWPNDEVREILLADRRNLIFFLYGSLLSSMLRKD